MIVHMKKSLSMVVIAFAVLLSGNTAFSQNQKIVGKTKTHLLEDILVFNQQIRKINYINRKSRNILKNTKNKYSYEIYLSFINIYKTLLWCSDLSHWLSQTYSDGDNMVPHIMGRLNANKKSIYKSLNYVNKIYKNINDVNLLNIIDTQEKIIDVCLGQLEKILSFAEENQKKH
jgi:hypothetical protein